MSSPVPGAGEGLETPSPARPPLRDIYLAFQTCALYAFGGVLPFARREMVEKRRWMADADFAELLGLCQFLPGPNISNLAIAVGSRFRGIPGALAALLGLYVVPVTLVLVIASFYARYGELSVTQGALKGIAAAAAGLILAMALKMAKPLRQQANPTRALAFLAATFVAVGLLRLPLLWALPSLMVAGIALARPRREAASVKGPSE